MLSALNFAKNIKIETVVPNKLAVNIEKDYVVDEENLVKAKEQIDELFRSDKFIESENSAVTGHHGFGLMLCAYIIKKHDDETKRGCKIWVESEVGKGTKIHFIIEKKEEK